MSTAHAYRNALPDEAQLHEYRVQSVLGAGGFGITYLCRDAHLDKLVAVKEYFPTDCVVRALDGGVLPLNAESAEHYRWGLERFIQEARTLARFSHPHIVRVNRYFEANGTGYMVMDYEAGQSLHQMLKGQPMLAEAQARQVLNPLLDGLQAVHDTGFLHRDIKPSNIFVRASGAPVLLDFGSARQAMGGMSRSLTSIVTPGFAPLEQYGTDGQQGPWTDIYALGGVLYRALSGENPPDAVSRVRQDTVPERLARLRGRVSAGSLAAVEWAMALDERNRPQTIHAWRQVLAGQKKVPMPERAAPALAPRPVAAAMPDKHADDSRRRQAPPAVRPAETGGTPLWRWLGGVAVLLVALGIANQWRQRGPGVPAAAGALPVPGQAPTPPAPAQAPVEPQGSAPAPQSPLPAPPAGPADTATSRDAGESVPAPATPGLAQGPVQARPADPPTPPGPLGPPPGPDLMAARKGQDFRRFDRDGDGFLSLDEVRDMPGLREDFRAIDTNRDNRISLDEFLAHRPPRPPFGGSRPDPAR